MSINQKVAKAAILVGFFSIAVKLASMVKEITVAKWFGRGDAVDAFLIAFLVPSFFVSVVSGSFEAALIPTYIQIRENEGKENSQQLFSSVMTFSVFLLIVVSIPLAILAPYYLPLLASGFSPEKFQLTLHLTYTLLPVLVVSGLVTVWSSVLNAGERFALPAWSPILVPLSAVVFLYCFGSTWGIYALAVGTVAGTGLNAALLAFGLKKQDISLKFGWNLDPALKQVMGQYAPMVAGACLMSSTTVVDQSMAAMLPAGSVAALGYGYKVIALYTGLVTMALSTSVLPYFSRQVATGDHQGIAHTFNTFLVLCLWIAVPAASFIYIFSAPLVHLLFQRGAFTAADTQVVAQVQAFFSFMLPTYTVGILGVKFVSAKLGNRILMYGAIINMTTNIVLNIIFMRIFGVAGIALSTAFVYLISVIYVMVFIIFVYRIAFSHTTLINAGILGATMTAFWWLPSLRFPEIWNLFLFLLVYGSLGYFSLKQMGWKLSMLKEIR